ncbi:MAG: hypothetical protein ACNA8W_18500, partial [Bradymonadaceae bacterium]
LWSAIEYDLRDAIRDVQKHRTDQLISVLDERRPAIIAREKERYEERIKEVSQAMRKNKIVELEKERDKAVNALRQLAIVLSEDIQREKMARLQSLEDELKLREMHYDGLRNTIKKERDTFIGHVLPKRLTLTEQVNVFPVTIELRFSR